MVCRRAGAVGGGQTQRRETVAVAERLGTGQSEIQTDQLEEKDRETR